MKNKTNIAELLKDCPKGMELYSPLCGECYFDRLNFGTIICKKQNAQEITFTSKGYYMLPVFDNCECMIFPSKDQRDWSKFVPPCKFKTGDVLFVDCSDSDDEDKSYQYIFILNDPDFYGKWHSYCHLDGVGCFHSEETYLTDDEYHPRFATEEEKQKLFDAIKAKGYKWNDETKTLEKLPKFKVGDKIKHKDNGIHCTLGEYSEGISAYRTDIGLSIRHKDMEQWELVPTKFDINTLKPFDKVLVRDNNEQFWTCDWFSFHDTKQVYPFACVGHYVSQCIPYEGNEHLLGTTDDCDNFYKTWE